jgi:hypothetical protein
VKVAKQFTIEEIRIVLAGDGVLATDPDGTQYLVELVDNGQPPGFRFLVKIPGSGSIKIGMAVK